MTYITTINAEWTVIHRIVLKDPDVSLQVTLEVAF